LPAPRAAAGDRYKHGKHVQAKLAQRFLGTTQDAGVPKQEKKTEFLELQVAPA
jgi:hypothetical protein